MIEAKRNKFGLRIMQKDNVQRKVDLDRLRGQEHKLDEKPIEVNTARAAPSVSIEPDSSYAKSAFRLSEPVMMTNRS